MARAEIAILSALARPSTPTHDRRRHSGLDILLPDGIVMGHKAGRDAEVTVSG
jgi:hypothetical protein